MKVGSIVSKDQMRSGAEAYGAAIVACLDPFLVVSFGTDMCWSTTKPEDWDVVGHATAEQINATQWRVPPQHQVRVPCGESFLSNELGCGLTLISLGTRPTAVDLKPVRMLWPAQRGWPDSWKKQHQAQASESFGYVFEYNAEDNLWRSMRQLETSDLQKVMEMVKLGFVTTGVNAKGQPQFVIANPEPITQGQST